MDMELTVEYDDEKIAKEEDKNEYIVYVPTTSNTATIHLTSINGNIAEVRNTTNANNIITVDSPDRTLYRLQVSNLSALTESNPYTYEVDVAKSGSSYKKTFKLIIMPQSTDTDITVTINGVEANWVASNGGYYDGSIETTDEIANVIVKAKNQFTKLAITEDGEPAPTLVRV